MSGDLFAAEVAARLVVTPGRRGYDAPRDPAAAEVKALLDDLSLAVLLS